MAFDPRTDVHIGAERVSHIGSTSFPGNYAGNSEASTSKEPTVKIQRLSQEAIEFDIIGVDTSVANAIRRILLAEIPTIAIDKVLIGLNTSMVQDEVLAHRMGLVPLRINPDLLDWKEAGEEATSSNTIVFSLNVKCSFKRGTAKLSPEARFDKEPEELYTNYQVFSGDLVFCPFGNQAVAFAQPNLPAPVEDDILLAKLRPGQEILCEAHCEKGIARDHAKWSPVAKASYRLLPVISVSGPIRSEHCDLFKQCFPAGVVEFDAIPGDPAHHNVRVVDARKDTVSREVLRHPEFAGLVTLSRRRDHFIFDVEAVGQFAPEALLPQAVQRMLAKIQEMRRGVSATVNGGI